MPLTPEENATLTQVGPGTPMGGLLRRYWHPVAAINELEEHPTRPVRLLGEDLVLYRDGNGNYGLIERWCAHRGTDLCLGYVEEYGLRCPRHGWLYSDSGQCLDMPMEEEPFSEEVKLNGYKVAERGGMLWAYLGPDPAPLVPDWAPFGWQDGIVQVVFSALSCNWLQCQENAIDPTETEWLISSISHAAHGVASPRAAQLPPPPRNFAFEFDEFDYGFLYKRADKQDGAVNGPWDIGRLALWPNGLFVGDERSCRFEWRVPMDDTSTVNVAWFFDRAAPGASLPEQRIFHWFAPARDEDGEAITSHALNRKFAVWLHQPVIVDRSKEVLGASDGGVVMLRDKYLTQIALLSDGGEPKLVLRDAEANVALELPFAEQPAPEVPVIVKKSWPAEGETPVEEMPKPVISITTLDEDAFPYLAGQPEDVESAYRQVRAGWKST